MDITDLFSEKIKTPEEVLALSREWRRDGLRVVFVCGCFDLFHAGHVRHFAAAKSAGDVLVVAVHGDARDCRGAGAAAHIIDQRGRMTIAAAVGTVDYVVPLPMESGEEFIAALKPAACAVTGEMGAHGEIMRRAAASLGAEIVETGEPETTFAGIASKIIERRA
ncbi:MAG: adenylyltransferase/cytidyltransferase family protein [bacterium]